MRVSRDKSSARVRRGVMLLEVLISIALMVFGLAVIGIRLSTSLETARKNELWTTGMLLAETKMAELQAGAVPFKSTEDHLAGYFGIRYPGYSWRIEIEPCEIDNLYLMKLDIAYNPNVVEEQIANPDLELDFDDEGAQIIRTVYRLVPTPADLDLTRDFGIDLEGLQEQAGSGGGQGGEGGEGGGGAGDLWSLINDFLTQHPEILNENGGIDLQAVKNLPAEDFQLAMEILQQFVGRGAQLGGLEDQLRENLGEGGGGQGGRRGGRGGQDESGGGGDLGPGGNLGPGDVGGLPGQGGRGRGRGRDRDGGASDGAGGGRGRDGGNAGPGNDRGGDPGDRGGNAGGGRNFSGGRRGQGGPDGGAGPNRSGPNDNRGRNNPRDENRGGRPNDSNRSGGARR